MDLNPPGGGAGTLLIHYGSPMVTAANTVLVPMKTGASLYTLTTDYSLPAHGWTPSYGPTLSLRNRLYYPGAGGTVYYRDAVDSATGPTVQIAFYGNAIYSANKAAVDATVRISTPLVADRYGDIHFGFVATPGNAAGVTSGIARIGCNGAGSWVSAQALAGGDGSISQVTLNCAPALSNDQRTVYTAVSNGAEFGFGYLTSSNATTLAPMTRVLLNDPRGGLERYRA